MMRFGKTEDIPGLKKLWKECFSDEDAYIDAFFQALYQGEDVLLAEEDGILLGASFFLPGTIYIEETGSDIMKKQEKAPSSESGFCKKTGWQKIRYVYALAVFPQYRGRGIAGGLLKEACRVYDAPLIAEPANESLVGGFYEPLGFRKAFYLAKKQIKMPQYDLQAAQAPAVCIQPADADTYARIRDSHYKKHGYVCWPKPHLAFALSEHRANGGEALAVTDENREDILLYYTENARAVITETTLAEEDAVNVLSQFLGWRCETVLFTCRAEQTAEGVIALTGVIFGCEICGGYLNLTLD